MKKDEYCFIDGIGYILIKFVEKVLNFFFDWLNNGDYRILLELIKINKEFMLIYIFDIVWV